MAKQRKNNVSYIKNKGFDKNPQNINKNGRPKLLVNVLKEFESDGIQRISPIQIIQLFESLLNLSEEKLQELSKNKTNPTIINILAEELLNNPYKALTDILDRAYGKSKQQTEITNIDQKPSEILIKVVDAKEPRD